MYREPVNRLANAVILCQHWQYHIKHDGTCKAWNCCDGSPCAAPILDCFAQMYSSCTEQPVQPLFFALSMAIDYLVFGGDATEAYAHSPPPERPTYVEIDDVYAEWYQH